MKLDSFLGGRSYVIKPFRQLELTSRVSAQLRHMDTDEAIVRKGNYTLSISERELSFENKKINLTRIETMLLEALLVNIGHAVTHTTFAEKIWGDAHPNTVKNVRIHIKRLRAKLENEAGIKSLIQTKPGVGYLIQALTTKRV